jgi:iron(III) transport system permease protein
MSHTVRAASLPRPDPVARRAGHPAALATFVVLAIALPVLVLAARAITPTGDLWAHLAATVLPSYVANSLLLAVGVGLCSAVVGTATGWTVAMYRFPGRGLFAWALLLPLALPAYILAFAYTDALQFAGPVQTWLRAAFAWRRGDYWFPEMRSLGGAVFVLSAVLYPYTYLLTRTAFAEQSASVIEASRTLGRGHWFTFRRIALPLARPAIVAGASFAVMEALADFGAVSYFGVPTFTTGIFRTWFALESPAVAAQLAIALLAFVFLALSLERWSRGDARRRIAADRGRPVSPPRLAGAGALLAIGVCLVPILCGFVVPVLYLAWLSSGVSEGIGIARILTLAGNSALLGLLSAVVAVLIAVRVAFGARLARTPLPARVARLAMLGYATPGAVVAIGILIAVGWFDLAVDSTARWAFGTGTGLVLGGTLAAIVYGHVVRFFAVAYGAVDAGYGKIAPNLDAAARTLGQTARGVLHRIHLPLLRRSLLSAAILVFADVIKELPATMILRPFNFDTLATEAYQRATTERLDEAALPSLLIVAVGLVPVLLLTWQMARGRK